MDESGSNRRKLIIASIISILPALVILYLITTCWVNVPYWDQWDFSIIFDKYYSGSLTFSDLIAQHNESRKLFPRLIVLAAGLMTNWNVCVEMGITMLLACLISCNLFTLLNRIKDLDILNKLALFFVINLFLFSPAQWHNWLWGIQMVMYIPPLALTAGLVINTSDISIRRKVTYNSILSIISTFSYAHGMLVWVLLLPVNILFRGRDSKSKRERRRELFYICLYAIAALITIGLYFKGYRRPPHHPSLLTAFYKPVQAIKFFLAWEGSLFAPQLWGDKTPPLRLPSFAGGLVLSAFVLSVAYCIYRPYKNNNKLHLLYPWFAIGLFSISSGILTTFGRLGLGPYIALANKYITLSIYLPISVVALVYLIYVCHIRHKKIIARRFFVMGAPFLFFLVILYIYSYTVSVYAMKMYDCHLSGAKSALQFYGVMPDEKELNKLYPEPGRLVDRFLNLTRNGLLDFKPVDSNILKCLERVTGDGKKSNGFFVRCLLLADNKLDIYGWVRHPIKKNPANRVMLAYTDEKGNSKPFAILKLHFRRRIRPSVEKLNEETRVLKVEIISRYHFFDKIDISHMPKGNLQVSAWIVDIERGTAYQLAGTHYIRKL